ncbi:hypothetical protein ABB37_01188 [Leptomonas pyrrhocoris]|uniref:Uncharacterized protein n=1 Tax=Leptomonas pyrrhocoris TaxID=157538 RepID=A0A0N0VH69_LEPPY|nr:hypothetical protein ABB37_01188 [Leptomonas pyrrhocoris]KPA84678.1 hypothetical protein ABB37_01188 [Leptomonas pyrrhocoris]|eukprot:XP_015663117.1 hypothetical protein ABB37_01188 [Leptomonas pyrrhocoris]
MIASPLGPKWTTDNVAELFSASDVGLRDVLYVDAVADYLQSIQSVPAPGPLSRRGGQRAMEDSGAAVPTCAPDCVSCVLRYVNTHSAHLFALLQGSRELDEASKTVAAPEAAASTAAVGKLGHRKSDPSAAAASLPCGRKGSPLTLAAPPDATADALSAEECEHRALINLAELLSFCIAQSPAQSDVNAVVAACTEALSCSKTLEAHRAFAVQRLLLEAFDSDFETTTQVIADTLTPATIIGVVENLASNSIVAETLIALFGSALSAVWMVKPTTKTALFTSRWIALGFPKKLCAYLPIAIRDPGMYHYFYFFKELLKRGYSHSAGPVVDVLLGEPLVSDYVECILSCCEHDVGRSPLFTPDGAAAAPVSLAADGMEVLVSVVSLVRKSLVLPETSRMYEASTQCITPLRVIEAQASRITALLTPTAKGKAAQSSSCPLLSNYPPQGFGPLRLAVCELFVEFSLFQLAEVDRTLISSKFFPAFFACCERFPQHDALARCLHRCVLAIFQRATLVGESPRDAADRDLLWKYAVQPKTVRLQGGKAFSMLGAMIHFAEVPNTALSSHCIDVLTNLTAMPLFQATAGGPHEEQLAACSNSEPIQERVRNMATPITGKEFEKPGSAPLPLSVHRDTINLAGDRFRGSRTGGIVRSSRLSGAARKVSKGAYTIVRHSSDDDDRPQRVAADHKVDIDALKQEVRELQEAGSPQLRSYPNFGSMHLGFFSTPEGQSDDDTSRRPEKEASTAAPLATKSAAMKGEA